ncbi:LuxR C-terminal-related transcriptional regulator [Amycolatopsis panacis]|uniref:Response regulatory domain-containing protein n=1 Tax=Amycolatopsis panacis TaxID=2340917 RepID=A0A419IB37_9PSEU|nr:hypothetical protein D5S19_02000 [Amycolatopsis panacis]
MTPYRVLVCDDQELMRGELRMLLESADQLFIGVTTVKTHLGRVLDKLEVRDRLHAVVFAD